MTSPTSSHLVRLVRELAPAHAGLGLASLAGGAVRLDAATLARFAGIEAERSDARALREDLVRWLRTKNQFLSLTSELEDEIEDAILRVLEALAEGDLEEAQDTLDDALDGLGSIVRDAGGGDPREVVASEYAPDLQLHVLGLAPSDVVSPVLDIGCGASAALVLHLRGLGHEVTGSDRDAPPSATRADWLGFDYGKDRWKTIVSHLGFSLHFLRAHHASEDAARHYAEAFVRITRSLAPGGLFAYAPSLPFFESVLPKERFAIERRKVKGGETLERLRATSGIDLAESTKLRRIG